MAFENKLAKGFLITPEGTMKDITLEWSELTSGARSWLS
jgi:hypothetical protein